MNMRGMQTMKLVVRVRHWFDGGILTPVPAVHSLPPAEQRLSLSRPEPPVPTHSCAHDLNLSVLLDTI